MNVTARSPGLSVGVATVSLAAALGLPVKYHVSAVWLKRVFTNLGNSIRTLNWLRR